MSDNEDALAGGLIEVEVARTRAVAAMIDGATPYLGIVEAVSADGRSVNVRRADEAPGVGLAAIQVGEPVRIITIDVARDEEPKNPMFLVNPEIVLSLIHI